MQCVVQKFGGTSMATVELIRNAAYHVQREVAQGAGVIVVVSAMAGTTDQLVGWAREALGSRLTTPDPDYDTVLSAGEQITSGLMALILQSLGMKARAWQGWQLPVLTSATVGDARIRQIEVQPIRQALTAGEVVVVPGFQGVTEGHRITTLGRGGSDTTAVALAAICRASWCDIYTDVDGVYTADPRLVPYVRKIPKIDYASMLELAAHGAKVLHPRSVEIAYQHNVKLRVLSSFVDYQPTIGTWIVQKGDLEYSGVMGIATALKLTHIMLPNMRPQSIPGVLRSFEDQHISYDIGAYNREGMSLVVSSADASRAQEILLTLGESAEMRPNVGKVTLVGIGLPHHPTIMHKLWGTLHGHRCEVISLGVSESAYRIVMPEDQVAPIARALHAAYELDTNE